MHVTNPEMQLAGGVRSDSARPSLDWMAWVIEEMTTLRPYPPKHPTDSNYKKKFLTMLWHAAKVNGFSNKEYSDWVHGFTGVRMGRIHTHKKLRGKSMFLSALTADERSAFEILTNGEL